MKLEWFVTHGSAEYVCDTVHGSRRNKWLLTSSITFYRMEQPNSSSELQSHSFSTTCFMCSTLAKQLTKDQRSMCLKRHQIIGLPAICTDVVCQYSAYWSNSNVYAIYDLMGMKRYMRTKSCLYSDNLCVFYWLRWSIFTCFDRFWMIFLIL